MNIPMILIPAIQRQGEQAATEGTAMTERATPEGFTFCPYRDGSVERWNFLCGCIAAYMGPELRKGAH